jgi:ADP-ribosylglycohydrolase
MKNPNPDMLVYIAIADACAMAIEYVKSPELHSIREKCLEFTRYIPHPRHGSGKGRYTDDTEMSIANAKVLTSCAPPFTKLMFADAYVEEFIHGGRRKGYSRKFQSLLEEVSSGPELLSKLIPESAKNGAAMRSAPLGALNNIKDVLSTAKLQATVTHDTPEGIFSSRAVALMSHFALYEDQSLNRISDYCLDLLEKSELERFGYIFREKWYGTPVVRTGNISVGITTVHAVVDAITSPENSLMKILKKILHWGGDADSVAAIAWGIASARYQDEELPIFMRRDLELGNPSTGVKRLETIGTNLMGKYNLHP